MIALVRDLAGLWADKRFVAANHTLRRKLIATEAAVDRLTQEKKRLSNALRSYGQLCQSHSQMRQQAEQERDAARAELEQARPIIEAAILRAKVLDDGDMYGSGAPGWYDRDRESDIAIRRAVGALPSPPAVLDEAWQDVTAAGLGTEARQQ